jgi:hypothetical protein
VRAGRIVVGMRMSFRLVSRLEGRLVVEYEAVQYSKRKERRTRARQNGRSDARNGTSSERGRNVSLTSTARRHRLAIEYGTYPNEPED